jgi:hypothetical protein
MIMRILRFALLAVAILSPILAEETGYLCVKAKPGRAGVFLDGKYLGPAANFRIARTYAVPAGQHELKLVDPRYEEVTQSVTVPAGKKIKVRQQLKALPVPAGPFGKIRTENADRYAAVYLNGKYYGHVDEFSNASQGILLPPGDYEVRIEPLSGQPVSKAVKVAANQTVVVK